MADPNSNSCPELEQFFELAVDLLSIIGPDGGFKQVNPAFENRLGWPASDLVSRLFLDFVHPDDLAAVQSELAQLSQQPQTGHFECRYRCQNGSYRWLSWHLQSTAENQLYATARDVTEQRWAELSLRENEVKFRSLFERSPDAILLLDGQKFIDCNPAALEMMRCDTKDELLDIHPSELSPERQPDGRLSTEKSNEMIQKAFELGTWRFEWVHRRTDGHDLPVEVTLTVVPLADRQVLYTEWRDITDRKQVEEGLQASEEALRTVFNSVHDAIFLHELDGSIIDINEKMLEMYGVDREQAFSLSIAEDYSSPENPLEELPPIWEKVVAGEDQIFEWKARRPADGTIFEAEVFLTKIQFREREAILATVSDISERVRLEQEIRDSLERRKGQVELSTEVAQEIAAAPVLDDLFRQVVELVQERFDYYHAHVYTLEEEDLVMQEGTGKAGRRMKADGHKIPLAADQSLVARAARSGTPVLVPDVSQEPDWLPNPLLPETQAEIAVPIKLGDQVLGVLDVQDEVVGSLGEEDQLLLVGLCGQIAVAINTRQAEEALQRSQAQLSEALEIARLAYWELDVASQTFTFNDQIYTLFGTTVEQEGGYHMTAAEFTQRFVHPEEAATIGIEIQKALETDDPDYTTEFESRLLRPNGQERRIAVQIRITKDELGQTVKLYGTNQDITERKRAEEMLAKRAAELETVAQVSTQTARVLDPTEVLQTVVDLAKAGFELYHAHIYLLNETGDVLNLAAGADEVGRQMVAEGWHIPLDREDSLVARAARTGQGIIANDVRKEPDFLPNPLLPDTRSELAVPIILEDWILGVLDVQADVPDRFTDEDVRVKTTLAAQVAVALQNARLFERSEQALQELDALTRRLTGEGWQTYFDIKASAGLDYIYDLKEVLPTEQAGLAESELAGSTLAQTLTVQGETIGSLELVDPQSPVDNATEVVEAVAQRLSAHLENLRLTEQTERALAETELLYNVSRRLNEASDLQEIVAATVEELDLPDVNRAVLMLFDYDAKGMVEAATVRANWHSGQGSQPTPVGIRYTEEMLKAVFKELLRTEPLFVDQTSEATAQQQNIRSMAILPLWVGTRQLGVFLLETEVKHHFTDQEMRPATSLAQQMAVAIENQRLFEQTQTALTEVQQSQEFLQTLLDNLPNPVFYKDLNGAYLGFNRAFLEYIGQSAESLMGKTVYDLNTDKALADKYHKMDMELFRNPGTQVYEARVKYADGMLRDVIFTKATFNNPDGSVGGLIGTIVDISDRKRIENTLYEKEVQLSEALKIGRLGYWEYDVARERFIFNDQFYETYHTTAEEQGGYTMSPEQLMDALFHPEDAHIVAVEIQKALESTEADYSSQTEFRSRLTDSSGEPYYHMARFRVERDETGRVTKLVGAIQDITEQKRAEKVREQLLAEVEAAYRQYVRQEWEQFLGERHQDGWHLEHQQPGLAVEPAFTKSLAEAQEEAIYEGKTKLIAGDRINGHETEPAVVSPISLRGQVIGTLSLQDIDPDRRWTAEEIALVETVSEQLALTVENLRLIDNTQKRATREQLTRQIVDRMRQAPDVDAIINTGLTELAKALDVSRTYVKLGSESKPIESEVDIIRNRLKPNGQSKRLPATTSPSTQEDKADYQDQHKERE